MRWNTRIGRGLPFPRPGRGYNVAAVEPDETPVRRSDPMNAPLWKPSPERVAASNLSRFIQHLKARHGLGFADYAALYEWSVTEIDSFWEAVWDFCGVIAEGSRDPVLIDRDKMPGAIFYPEARLNFAENLLRRRDDRDAIVFWGEDKVQRRLSHAELYDQVAQLWDQPPA